MHHGTVNVKSTNRGCEFRIDFPLEIEERKKSAPADAVIHNKTMSQRNAVKETITATMTPDECVSNDESGYSKKTVLIAEDNPDLREYLIMNLKDTYNVRSAEDGRRALEEARKSGIDIIIADIMMPEMDGFKFKESLSAIDGAEGIPFIFLTAKAEISDQLKGLGQGAVDYIVKPFDMDKLLGKIKALLSLQQSQRQQRARTLEKKLSGFIKMKEEPKFQQMEFETFCLSKNISNREKEILLILKEGLKNDEIAQKLNISSSTVKNHISSILQKCQVKNRTQLIRLMN